jgi:hypothetical protein
MKCEYCKIRESKFITKNGKNCCEKYYQACPLIREKNSKKLSESLKKQYNSGKRVSHFKKINDGSFWKGKKHKEETKEKISKSSKGRTMNNDFRIKRSEEMKVRYSNGWESFAGRTKKIKYVSPIAGEVLLDGTWEFKTAIYFDNNQINWKRNKKRFDYIDTNGKKRSYCPDFYLIDSDLFIEVKGYETQLDKIKWSQFTERLEIWDKTILKQKKIL